MKENFLGIGERIKLALDAKGFKQIDACKKADISKNAISNYINGNRIPDTASLYKLSKLLDVPMEWLLTGEGKAPIIILESAANASSETYVVCQHIEPSNFEDDVTSKNSIELTEDEHELIHKYREISRNDKEEVAAILNIKYARVGVKKGRSSASMSGENGEDAATKELA